MTTQVGAVPSNPYVTPDPMVLPGAVPGVLETTITASLGPIVSGTTHINAETYNGTIPGPTLRLSVGDTAIVRLVNKLPYSTGIHWHGSPGGYADGPAAWFTFDAPMGATGGHWTEVAGPSIDRAKGMSVVLLQPTYPYVRVAVFGGGSAGTNGTAQVINLSTLSPTWGQISTIPHGRGRVNGSAMLLPDSTVLVCGGLQSAPYPTWIYRPNALVNAWREMDEMNRPRHYHSCALLLPRGKVMVAGGASSSGCSLSVENSIEVFSPPYLFSADGTAAARAVIEKVNGEVPTSTHAPQFHHGSAFTIEAPQAESIAKVVLIRPMAVTHQTDSKQRVLHLTFHQGGPTQLTATAPDGIHPHAMAPSGYYMLFILDGNGVPSEGKFIQMLMREYRPGSSRVFDLPPGGPASLSIDGMSVTTVLVRRPLGGKPHG